MDVPAPFRIFFSTYLVSYSQVIHINYPQFATKYTNSLSGLQISTQCYVINGNMPNTPFPFTVRNIFFVCFFFFFGVDLCFCFVFTHNPSSATSSSHTHPSRLRKHFFGLAFLNYTLPPRKTKHFFFFLFFNECSPEVNYSSL